MNTGVPQVSHSCYRKCHGREVESKHEEFLDMGGGGERSPKNEMWVPDETLPLVQFLMIQRHPQDLNQAPEAPSSTHFIHWFEESKPGFGCSGWASTVRCVCNGIMLFKHVLSWY